MSLSSSLPTESQKNFSLLTISEDEGGLRLDKYIKEKIPGIPFATLQKALRTGQIRVNGKRKDAAYRLEVGDSVRIPPMLNSLMMNAPDPATKPVHTVSQKTLEIFVSCILYEDDAMLVINKPMGLAVQGGTNMALHVDAILDALVEGGRYTALTRPRLVHRLDKDTSGILILGKSQKAASFLARAFADHSVSKLYWACVLGHPKTNEGKVSLKLTKKEIGQQEKIYVDEEEGKSATTLYTLLDTMNKRISWLGLVPLTGRTHQLRVHCAYMQMPILGDGKYGRHADITRELGISGRHLHLHAREIWVPHPEGSIRKFQAPLPNHMKDTFKLLGFSEKDPQSLRKSTEILLKSHEKR